MLGNISTVILTASQKVRMLRCAASFVTAAYGTVRLIPQNLHALPVDFLRSRPQFKAFATFYESAIFPR